MAGRNRPWSDLPEVLLTTIANKLTSKPISIFTFRSICHSWRNSCPPVSNPSLSILEPPLLPLSVTPLRLSVTIIYALHRPRQFSSMSSPETWILFVDEFTRRKLSIRIPFSTDSYSTPINFPNINLIDFNVRELGRFHSLSYSNESHPGYSRRPTLKRKKPSFYQTDDVNQVVMFPANRSSAIALRNNGALRMYRLENVGIDNGMIEYETKHLGKKLRFDDIVEYKSRVLGIDRRGRVFEINYRLSSESVELSSPFVGPITGGGGRRKRLVESLGRLYLVVRCKKQPEFKVYELNEGRNKWCEITSLGDRSFSFGVNFSFSASAEEFGIRNNCILFANYSFEPYSGYYDDHVEFLKLETRVLDIGVWHMDDNTNHNHVNVNVAGIESYPHYSALLWPPPGWIWNAADSLKRIRIVETAIQEMRSSVVASLKTYAERDQHSFRNLESSLAAGDDILNLREMVIGYHREGETTFMHEEDQESEDILHKDFLDLMSKVGRFFERPSIPIHWTNEARLGLDAFLFHIEEQVTELELSLDSRLK